MHARFWILLLLAALVAAGCSTAAQLQARKDNAWSHMPQALPDDLNANPSGYGHPFRILAVLLQPVGVALDYALIRPTYMLGGLSPEWFGMRAEDAQRYQSHFPTLITPQNAPHRFE